MGIWVLALMGLPFAAVGALVIVQGYHAFCSGPPALIPILMFWPFGLIFSAVGWAMILLGLFGKPAQPGQESPLAQRKRMLGILTPQEEWRAGRLRSKGKGVIIVAWLGAAAWTVMLAPVLWIGVMRGWRGGEAAYVPWCLAAIWPAIVVGRAIYKTLRWRKFGTSICDLQRRPSETSGELRCLIQPEIAILPSGETTATLCCEKREFHGTGKGRSLQKTVLWQEQKVLAPQPEGFQIDVSFQIPPTVPESSSAMAEGVFWTLTVRRPTPGVDYFAEFDLAFTRAR